MGATLLLLAAPLLLALTSDPATANVCKPGEIMKKGCLICQCFNEGYWSCIKGPCTTRTPCVKGDVKYDDCNTCTCTKDGQWMCTKNICLRRKRETMEDTSMDVWSKLMKPIKSDMGENRRRSEVTDRSSVRSECLPGEMKMDGCNICKCSAGGTWNCTSDSCGRLKRELRRTSARVINLSRSRSVDMDQTLTEDKDALDFRECLPDETLQIDCHSCTCTKEGRWQCKLVFCVPGLDGADCHRKKRSVENCKPNTSFRRGTDTCFCDENGTAISCNNSSGLSRERRQGDDCSGTRAGRGRGQECTASCVPNTTFKVDCNTCRCNEDGVGATCTVMACN